MLRQRQKPIQLSASFQFFLKLVYSTIQLHREMEALKHAKFPQKDYAEKMVCSPQGGSDAPMTWFVSTANSNVSAAATSHLLYWIVSACQGGSKNKVSGEVLATWRLQFLLQNLNYHINHNIPDYTNVHDNDKVFLKVWDLKVVLVCLCMSVGNLVSGFWPTKMNLNLGQQ